ncbi:MAG: hypothetical protein RLY16_270 [Bacteroidota bacterium]|jgi:hypothetical protein
MLVYITYFIILAFLAIRYEFGKQESWPILIAVILGLGFLAGLRHPDIERDYQNYLFSFDMIYEDKNPLFLAVYEPGFFLIVFTIKSIIKYNYGVAIMLVYAFCSVIVKTLSIKKLAINPYLVMLFYFSHFFFLHEMTQIRIGLATAFFFAAIPLLLANKNKSYIAFILLATLFHYTAILYLFLLLLKRDRINRVLFGGILISAIAFAFLKLPLIGILSNFNSNEFSSKIDNYAYAAEFASEKINVLNTVTIFNILTCLYLLIAVSVDGFEKDKRLTLFLKCNIISVFLLAVLSSIPSIAFRISDLFGVLSMFTFSYLARYLPFGKYNIFFTIGIAAVFFYFFALNSDLIKPYRMVDFR